MTDKQTIHQLRVLVARMHRHMDHECTDYDGWKCEGCAYAVHKDLKCRRFEHFEKRMVELGVRPAENFRYIA